MFELNLLIDKIVLKKIIIRVGTSEYFIKDTGNNKKCQKLNFFILKAVTFLLMYAFLYKYYYIIYIF